MGGIKAVEVEVEREVEREREREREGERERESAMTRLAPYIPAILTLTFRIHLVNRSLALPRLAFSAPAQYPSSSSSSSV